MNTTELIVKLIRLLRREESARDEQTQLNYDAELRETIEKLNTDLLLLEND